MNDSDDFENEWVCSFHGVAYNIDLIVNGNMLTLDAEQTDTNERWSGQFTSQYIEDITHKAGNYKKFNVFCKMLSSAFSKDSDSVLVDLLTYADLEALKAKKTGKGPGTSNPNSKTQLKRYVILTYQSEFDRVHYPLPLAFEDKPNVEAMQRTIKKLRANEANRSLNESFGGDSVQSANKLVGRLREENTELRHRLRQTESRVQKLSQQSNFSPRSDTKDASELALAYSKLKKQNDATRKELQDLSVSYERLKNESNREVAKWKAKFVSAYEASTNSDNTKEGKKQADLIRDLRRKVATLEKEKDQERAAHRKELASQRKEIADLMKRAPTSARSTGSGRSTTSGRASSADRARNRESIRERQREADRLARARGGSRGSTRSSGYGDRSVSPNIPSARSRPTSSRSISPALSRGKTFDPTEWFNQQKEKRARAARIAWGSGSPRDGYSSDGSRGSRGSMRSMSAGSERSASARSIRSTASSQDSRASDRKRRIRERTRAAERERQDSLMLDKIPSRAANSKPSTSKKSSKKSTSKRTTNAATSKGYNDDDYNEAMGHSNHLENFMSMGMPPKHRDDIPPRSHNQRKTDNELMMESITSLPSHRSSADNSADTGLQPTTSRMQLRARSPSLMSDEDDGMQNWNQGVKGHQIQASPRQNMRASPSSSSSALNYGSHSPTSKQIIEQRMIREAVTSGNTENVRPLDKNTSSKPSPLRGDASKSPRVGSFPMTSDLSDLSAINAGAGASSLLRRSVDSSVSASVDLNKRSDSSNYKTDKTTKNDENDDLEDFEHLTIRSSNNNDNGMFSNGPSTTDTDATGDLTEIDKRIMALQSFLENARSGIFENGGKGSTQ